MIFRVVFKFGYVTDHSPGYAEGWSEGIGLIRGLWLHPDSAVSRSAVDLWELFGLGGSRLGAGTLTAWR